MSDEHAKIPRSREDDYSPEIIAERQAFIETETGVTLNQTTASWYAPHATWGNVEHVRGESDMTKGRPGQY